jgi:adenylylsulfate kinase-like enzyme
MTRIVVTGPPGSGVSLVAAALAARLHSRSIDGDELHPPISRGRRARPADVDHEAWLRAIALVFTKDAGVVVSSGALSAPIATGSGECARRRLRGTGRGNGDGGAAPAALASRDTASTASGGPAHCG